MLFNSYCLPPMSRGAMLPSQVQHHPFPVELSSWQCAMHFMIAVELQQLYQIVLSWSLLEYMLLFQICFKYREVYGFIPNNPVLSTPSCSEHDRMLNIFFCINSLGLCGCYFNPSRLSSLRQSCKWRICTLIAISDFSSSLQLRMGISVFAPVTRSSCLPQSRVHLCLLTTALIALVWTFPNPSSLSSFLVHLLRHLLFGFSTLFSTSYNLFLKFSHMFSDIIVFCSKTRSSFNSELSLLYLAFGQILWFSKAVQVSNVSKPSEQYCEVAITILIEEKRKWSHRVLSLAPYYPQMWKWEQNKACFFLSPQHTTFEFSTVEFVKICAVHSGGQQPLVTI